MNMCVRACMRRGGGCSPPCGDAHFPPSLVHTPALDAWMSACMPAGNKGCCTCCFQLPMPLRRLSASPPCLHSVPTHLAAVGSSVMMRVGCSSS